MLKANLRSRDVTSSCAKALSERAHENVNILRIATKVVDSASSTRTQCSDTVSLVQI